MYFSSADIRRTIDGGGIGISGIQDQPQLYDVTLTRADGSVVQVTSPAGFAALGDTISGGAENTGSQDQYSLFFGHNWEITDALTFDWGVRYESIEYDVTNRVGGPPPNANDPTRGGTDGNPLTLYDNLTNVQGPPISAQRDYDYLSYSASLAYEFSENLSGYARYSSGEKAPDFQSMVDLDTPDEVSTLFIEPQEIQQFEVGVKYRTDKLNLAVYPFWSELDNVTSTQLFSDENGVPYSPPPTAGKLVTTGLEIEADYQFTNALNLRTALTLQTSEASGFGSFLANAPTRADDTLVLIPDGDADNVPDILARTTLSYAPTDRFETFLTWNYLGDRPANRNNAFELPAFSIFDAGASFMLTENLRIGADIKNVLNEEEGVLSWSPSGGFLNSLDRQGLTPEFVQNNPNQNFSIVTAQPRSFFVTASYVF